MWEMVTLVVWIWLCELCKLVYNQCLQGFNSYEYSWNQGNSFKHHPKNQNLEYQHYTSEVNYIQWRNNFLKCWDSVITWLNTLKHDATMPISISDYLRKWEMYQCVGYIFVYQFCLLLIQLKHILHSNLTLSEPLLKSSFGFCFFHTVLTLIRA